MLRSRWPLPCSAALLWLALLVRAPAAPPAPGQALVIGEASYTALPARQACALSAHSVAAALRALGFTVDEREDASNGAIFAGIASLSHRIESQPDAAAFVYACGYVTGFADRPFLLPVSATVTRPADVLTQGILAQTLLDVLTTKAHGPAVLAIDALAWPKDSDTLALDRLAANLPGTVGLIAVRDTAPDDQPTPFARLLVPRLQRPAVESAGLLANLKPQLTGTPAQLAALHVPASGQYLAARSVPPAAGVGAETPQPTVMAAASPSTATSTAAAAIAAPPQPRAGAEAGNAARPARPLPDDSRLTVADRRLLQRELAGLGDYRGAIDGIFGPETRAAIRRWQQAVHDPVTGFLTAAEATRLASR